MPETQGSQARAGPDFVHRTFIVAAIAALALLMWALRDVVLLAFASVLIAVGLHGIADPIADRAPVNRAVALTIAGIVLLGVLIGALWLFGAQMNDEISGLINRLPGAWQRTRETLAQTEIGATLVREVENWGRPGQGPLAGIVSRVSGYTMSFASAVTNAVLVLFAALFFATSPRTYVNGALALLPHRYRHDVAVSLVASARALKKWLLGSLVSMLVITLMVGVALWLLGVPAFVGLALIAGIAQFVPVVGPLLAAIPGVAMALTVGPESAMWTALAYLVASQLEANLIYPLIQERAVSLPPALTLFAIIAMGLLFGPLGVLLATPILVVVAIFVVKLYVRGVLGDETRVPGA
jgi:predicted PurR-regulated permease PerM